MQNAADRSATVFRNPKWNQVPLSDVCFFVRGVGFEKHEVRATSAPGHLPILRAGNIQAKLDTANDLVWVPAERVADEQRLHPGDIAICLSSGSPAVVGKTAQLLEPFDGSVGAFCGIIRPRDSASAGYLGYWFRSADYLRWRDSQARGANIQNLRFSNLESVDIPWPPLSEQKRIAAILTEQMAAVEKTRAATEAQLEAAEAMVASYLRAEFDGLGNVRQVKLGELTTVVRGSSPRPKGDPRYYGGKVPRLMVEDVTRDGMYVTPKVDFLTEEGAKLSRPMRKGDLVMVVSGNPGLPAILNSDACIHDGFVGFRNLHKNLVTETYLFFFLRFNKEVNGAEAAGAIFQNLTTDQIKAFPIPLPPTTAQGHITSRLMKTIQAVDQLKRTLDLQLNAITKMLPALLHHAFNGEI